jgi:hypothetical protein
MHSYSCSKLLQFHKSCLHAIKQVLVSLQCGLAKILFFERITVKSEELFVLEIWPKYVLGILANES